VRSPSASAANEPESVGRYHLYPAVARGGMATVHPARLVGAEGFTRLVAVKRLLPELASDPEFVRMFRDEARIAACIHHPNVVPVLDVVTDRGELLLVQEYVHGVPLAQLMKTARAEARPLPIAQVIAVITSVLSGLHAAHEARDPRGRPLDIVHRDVSPQNVMLSVDGVPRLLDFGIAKARTSEHHTRDGVFKGKLAYMAPEQLRLEPIGRGVDLYAAGVLLWELLVNRRIFEGRNELGFVNAVVSGELPTLGAALAAEAFARPVDEPRLSTLAELEPVVARAMARYPEDRFPTAAAMAEALLEVAPAATALELSAWVKAAGGELLEQRRQALLASDERWHDGPGALPGPVTESARPVVSTPSGIAPVGRAASHPRGATPLAPSAAARVRVELAPSEAESDSFRLALGLSRLGRAAAKLRRARLLPFIAAGLLATAGVGLALARAGGAAGAAEGAAAALTAVPMKGAPPEAREAEGRVIAPVATEPLSAPPDGGRPGRVASPSPLRPRPGGPPGRGRP
jgi:serine/threonine-protein kinase